MSAIENPDRRNFLGKFVKGASVTALAGALGTQTLSAQTRGNNSSSSGPINLDIPYNRRGMNCSRWDSPTRNYGDKFKYGMGVASLDFEAPACITEALVERCEHHTWGYISNTDSLRDALVQWNGERQGLDMDPESIVISHGVYPGVIAALRTFVPAGTKTLMMSPVYSGFYYFCRHTKTEALDSELVYRNGRYEVDWDDLEAKMTPDVGAIIVCNPQNPTGNVWSEEELLRIGRMALDKQIVVLSDEIHSDFVRAGHKFTPFANLPDADVVNNSVSFSAISKTFNLAGMKTAYWYTKNPVLKARMQQNHRSDLNILGIIATEAAYREGGDWFDQVLPYLDANHSFTADYVKKNLPAVGYKRAEGTYLTWLDFSRVMAALDAEAMAEEKGFSSPEHYLQDWMVENSGVLINPGANYGTGGKGHMRMNIGSSRVVVEEALASMARAINRVV